MRILNCWLHLLGSAVHCWIPRFELGIMSCMSDVTRILSQIENGDDSATEHLLPLVYEELRKLASAKLAHELPGQTLQATALVHEAYVRLVNRPADLPWEGRRHFFAAVAEAMRRILIEKARQKSGPKAGGRHNRIELSQIEPQIAWPSVDVIALNDALLRLAEKYPRSAEVVKLRFFAGLTNDQVASVLNVAVSTVKLDWTYAKNWLRAELIDEPTN